MAHLPRAGPKAGPQSMAEKGTTECGFSCSFHMTQPTESFVRLKLFNNIPKQNAKLIILGARGMRVRAKHPYSRGERFWLLVCKVAGKEKVYF